MRLIFLLFTVFSIAFSNGLNFDSISSHFTQVIKSPENSVITYEGKLYAKKPHFVLWEYNKPNNKSIYIIKNNITIVEPELEQVIISKLEKTPNISSLFKKAKQISKNLYITIYDDITYQIFVKDKSPYKLIYKDKLDNETTITFTDVALNVTLDDILFNFSIPSHYDVIKN